MSRDANDDDRSYLAPYERAVDEMGAGFEAQLWRSREAQHRRFEVIARALGADPGVVADMGCGTGDLFHHLHEHGHAPERAIGIEGVARMTEHARVLARERGMGHAIFETHDFVADASLARTLVDDAGVGVFVFSGSLNTLAMDHAQRVLARFWGALERAGRGSLIFNFLSTRHDTARTPASPPAVRHDPVAMLGWALDRTPLTRLEHDYLGGHDATIAMRVAAPGQPRGGGGGPGVRSTAGRRRSAR